MKNIKIVKIWKYKGDEEKCTIKDVKAVINGNYDNPNEVLKMFMSGKIKEVQSTFAVYQRKAILKRSLI